MRGQPNTFRESWIDHTVTTPVGELTFTVFPCPPPWFGCTRLDGVPIALADAHCLLEQLGDEHASTPDIGVGSVSVSPRQSM